MDQRDHCKARRRRRTRRSGLEFTRRAVLQGGGAVAASYATRVLANTNSPESWRVERDGDPRVAERQVYYISYRADNEQRTNSWILPEIAFGETARIQIGPRPLGPGDPAPTNQSRVDQRVRVAGINLMGDNSATFNLIIDLRYGGKDQQTPVIAFGLEDWVFKSLRQVAKLQGDSARKSTPVETTVAEKTIADFVEAIFGTRARLARQGAPRLTFEFPTDPTSRNYVVWRISSGITEKAVLEIPSFAEGSGDPVATSPIVDVTRVADEARPNAATTGSGGGVTPLADLAQPKTVARFVKGTFGRALALGAHSTPEKTRLRLDLQSPSCSDNQEPTLTRSAGGQVNFRVSKLRGDLCVVGEGAPRSRTEGPFQVCLGDLAFVGAAAGGSVELTGEFDLRDQRVSLHSTFGPLEIEAPEPKRTLPFLPVLGGDDEPRLSVSNPLARAVSLRAANGTMTAFSAVARVVTAAVALRPDKDGEDPLRDYRVDLGFGGAETLFFLHGLTDQAAVRPAIGRIALGARPDAASTSAEFAPLYSLPLESATLRLTRWRDLEALSFRFAGLDLTFEAGGFMVRPRGLARQSTPAFTNVAPSMSGAVADSRPLLVVDLPPQHVAEEAFFVQRALRPQPPDYPLEALAAKDPKAADEARKKFADLRSLYLRDNDPLDGDAERNLAAQRQAARQNLQGIVNAQFPTSPKPDAVADYTDFADEFAGDATLDGRLKRLPAEQRIYVGPEFLDPEARFLAEEVRNARAPGTPMFDFLPEDPVSDAEKGGIAQANPNATPKQVEDVAEDRRKMRDPAYVLFRDTWTGACSLPRPSSLQSAIDRYCNSKLAVEPDVKSFKSRTQLLIAVEKARIDKTATIEEINALSATMFWVWNDTVQKLGLTGTEEPTAVSRHFLSGPSRLAFRINTDDARDEHGGAFAFSADNLTNWSRHELVVVRRAQKLFKAYEEGTRRPAWDRAEDTDLAEQLVAQGFSRGGFDPDLAGSSDNPRNWPLAFVTAEQRLGEVTTLAAAPPSDFETSIEMPFRLQLSPAQDGRFRTRRVVRDWIFATLPGDVLKTVAEPTPLWTAEFEVEPNSALRAIWSPDFRSEAFRAGGLNSECPSFDADAPDMSRADRPPPHGPYAPWMISRGVADCTTFPWPVTDMQTLKFRTSLDASDRHELVTLSSVHGLPVIGKLKDESGLRAGIDQQRPPNGFQVATGGWDGSTGRRDSLRQNDIYVPPPLDVEGLELAMSSLGGFLRVNAHFDPPASILDGKGQSYFPALSVERWRHRIVLGRDISAEVVYKGYLYPCGQRAALVKISERRFEKVEGRQGPVAVLRQRMFLRIPNRPKRFGAFRQADSGRRLPFTEMLVTTLITPDIVDPYDNDSPPVAVPSAPNPPPPDDCKPGHDCVGNVSISASGRLNYGGAGVAFWPRVAKRAGSEVKFDFLLDGKVSTRLPFIFVDNAAANDRKALAAITRYYSRLSGELSWSGSQARDAELPGLALVSADIKGAKLVYAPEGKSGDTQHETYSLVFAAEGRGADTLPRRPGPDDVGYQPLVVHGNIGSFFSDPFMQGADQPPFYPAMRFATIRAAQIERLTGRPLGPVRVAYDPSYARAGFDAPLQEGQDKLSRFNARDIYLSIIAEPPPSLDFGSAGERGGAVARPQTRVLAFSRGLGPVGVREGVDDGDGRPQASNDYDWPPAVALWYGQHQDIAAPAGAGGLPIVPVNDGGGGDGVPPALKAFFDPNAKLLGLVELAKVIEAVTGVDPLPVLHEINEFGGDLAGSTDQQVRENVLQPLRDALVAFKGRIDGIDKEIEKSTPSLGDKGPSSASFTVREVYHDVYVTLQGLIVGLDAALGSPSASDAIAAFAQAKAYSAIYAKGKSFLAALDKAVRDPATPLTQKAQDYLKSFEEELTSRIPDDVRKDLDLLATLDDSARKSLGLAVRDRLVNQVFAPLFATLFPPPTPGMMGASSTLQQTLLDALVAPGVWPVLDGTGTAGFDPKVFGNDLSAHGVADDAIKIYLGSDALELAAQTGKALEAIKSVVAGKGDPVALLGAFSAFADPLQKSLQIAKLSNALRDTCQNGAAAVTDYVALLGGDAVGAVNKLHDSVQAAQNVVVHNGDAIKAALKALTTKFGSDAELQTPVSELADAYATFLAAVTDADIASWCMKLSDTLGGLASSLPAPAALCGGTAGAFSKTVKSLKEVQSLRNGIVRALKSRSVAARTLLYAAGDALPHFLARMNGSALFAPDLSDGTWTLTVPAPGSADEPFAALAATLAANLLVKATSLLADAANTLSATTLAKVLVGGAAVSQFFSAYDAFSNVWSTKITDPIKGALPAGSAAVTAQFDASLFKKTRDMAAALSALTIPTSKTVSDWSLYASQASGDLVQEAELDQVLDTVVGVVGDAGEPLKTLVAGAFSGWTESRLILVLAHAGPPEALLADAVATTAKSLDVATVAQMLRTPFLEAQKARVELAQEVFALQSLPLQALAPLRARARRVDGARQLP
jgi:hypothetical protein